MDDDDTDDDDDHTRPAWARKGYGGRAQANNESPKRAHTNSPLLELYIRSYLK